MALAFFEIIPAVNDLAIQLASPDQQKKYHAVLKEFKGETIYDLVLDLSAQINSKSMQVIFRHLLSVKQKLGLINAGRNFETGTIPLQFSALSWNTCLSLLCERINSQEHDFFELRSHLRNLNAIICSGNDGAMPLIEGLISQFGYSRLVLKKLLLFEALGIHVSDNELQLRSKIFNEGNVRSILKDVLALVEMMKPRGRPFSQITSEQKPISLDGKFFSRPNFFSECTCPLPIHESQVPDFLNSLVGFSYVDQVLGVFSLHRVAKHRRWKVSKKIESMLAPNIANSLGEDYEVQFQATVIANLIGQNYSDFDLYNISLAFPEFGNATLFRNAADSLLLPKICATPMLQTNTKALSPEYRRDFKGSLDAENVDDALLHFNICNVKNMPLTKLMRFLKYRTDFPLDWSIDGRALGLLLSTELPIYLFINPSELEKFMATAQFNRDNLGSLFWTSLGISGKSNDDADYEFLRALENFATKDHQGDIVKLFATIGTEYPIIVAKLIRQLTPRRLQKCYHCLDSYSAVNTTHRRLLEIAAEITDDIDLIMQADQILLDEKLASVRAHIDSSRVYVEEVLFKNWVQEEIWPQFDRLRKQIRLFIPGSRENLTTAEISAAMKTNALQKIVKVLQEMYVDNSLQQAFEVFCRDHYFGVDSFLGRRIRHNATHGILLGQLDEICEKVILENIQYEHEIREVYHEWKRDYLVAVNFLANETFRFKSIEFSDGIMSVQLDATSERVTSITTDVITQVITMSRPEAVIDTLVTGCWGMLDPELKKVRTYLRSDFSKDTIRILNVHFDNLPAPAMELYAQLQVVLLEKIERLSSWFSPFNPSETSLSLSDLSQLIWTDGENIAPSAKLEISGNACDALVVGGNSRLLYDCLHVLLVNAVKHSNGGKLVELSFNVKESLNVGTNELTVEVVSSLSSVNRQKTQNIEHFERLRRILLVEDQKKKSMVVQGYSGLRKLKYLLYRMHREDTLIVDWMNDKVAIIFSLPIEFSE